jgi:transposase
MISIEEEKRIEFEESSQRSRSITEVEEQQLLAQLESCEDQAARSRLKAVILYRRGQAIEQVLEEVGCSRSSLLKWYRVYRLQGPQGLFDHRRGGNNARLAAEQIDDLTQRLEHLTPRDLFGAKTAIPDGQHWTVEDLCNAIWLWYGVSYKSRNSYYKLLRVCLPKSQQVEEDHNGRPNSEASQRMYLNRRISFI